MVIRLDTHSGVPIYRQILEQVRRQILAGRLAAGDKLPSVRALSAELRVNPMTVSKAYAQLERDDLVDRCRGVGLFVASLPRRAVVCDREELVVEALGKAVALARQLGVSADRCRALLEQEWADMASTDKESGS